MVVAGTDSGKPAASAGVAAHVHGLLAHLHDAAHDHVVDERRVEVVARHQGLERLGGEVDGMPPRSFPLRRPPAVRTASTITAVVMRGLLPQLREWRDPRSLPSETD